MKEIIYIGKKKNTRFLAPLTVFLNYMVMLQSRESMNGQSK
ncbi:MAG: hypothetical protein ACTSRW_03500 [Candidatus Helarchaeota archaeon]